ncbi:rRNA methyltransferase, partial [Streptomyces sp. DT17]
EPIQYDDGSGTEIGVGPHPWPWPEDEERYDPDLRAHGDRRNVGVECGDWTREAIGAVLGRRRRDFLVGVADGGQDGNVG